MGLEPRIAPAGGGQRTDPDPHYESLAVEQQATLRPPATITLVDDAITRGSTVLAMYQRLAEVFPQHDFSKSMLGFRARCGVYR